ncbi:MAG: hypothetical protein EOP11_12195, partial [Proteobacteria bacterium]
MSKLLFSLAALFFSTGFGPIARAEGQLDAIYDVDYRFFMQNPRLPWGKDAFRKHPGFVAVPATEEKLTLQGIARSNGSSTAIINGELVNIGSMVGQRKVVEIGAHFVVLEKGSSLIELTMNPQAQNSPPPPREPASVSS